MQSRKNSIQIKKNCGPNKAFEHDGLLSQNSFI